MSQKNHLLKHNGAETVHFYENKRVNAYKRNKIISKQLFSNANVGGIEHVIVCIHVSFGLQQKLTCLEVISKR